MSSSSSSSSASMSSWLEIPSDSDFGLANIPFGVFSLVGTAPCKKRCATAIGNHVVDLSVLEEAGCFDNNNNDNNSPLIVSNLFMGQENLNEFLQQPPRAWKHIRQRLQELFSNSESSTTTMLRDNVALQQAALYDRNQVVLHVPMVIGDYTDFYASREHATNVGIMFRGKDNALQPNWLHLPVGYHGRSSTIQVSGQPVRRPCGQLQVDPANATQGSFYGPCQQLDFELEVAAVVGGPANPPGTALTIAQAKERIFGFCLMNDWSARDIQKFEYVPLGPFTSKNWATTMAPWIVTTMALEEGQFACPTSAQEQTNPIPLPYLRDPTYSSYDIHLTVAIQSSTMTQPAIVTRSNFAHLYWNAAQQLVHHSVTGCVMNAGDLLGSGTISASTPDSYGSMLELSWKGTQKVKLQNGSDQAEERTFLQDGDTVIIQGWCQKDSDSTTARIGFGICEGQILPATPMTFEDQQARSTQQPQQATSDRYQSFKLYGYWKSSSTWRVRVALAAKNIPYETIPLNVFAGEQNAPSFRKVNALGQVPVLEFIDAQQPTTTTTTTTTKSDLGGGQVIRLSQSIAIMEFLDHAFPHRRSLFPKDPLDKAIAYQMIEIINSGTQPLQNLPFLAKLEQQSEGRIVADIMAKDVMEKGLAALEQLVVEHKTTNRKEQIGPYCLGTFSPSVVEAVVVPQLANAKRLGVQLDAICPSLAKIDALCAQHVWFQKSHPDQQPDAGT